MKEFDSLQDNHSSTLYMFLATVRAFGLWLEWVCIFYISIVTFSFCMMGDVGGNVGVAITQAIGLTNMVQFGMRQTAVRILALKSLSVLDDQLFEHYRS